MYGVDLTPSLDNFISVIEDITERKKLEAERDSLIEDLEMRVAERTTELEKPSRGTLSPALPIAAIYLDEVLGFEWGRAVRVDDRSLYYSSTSITSKDRIVESACRLILRRVRVSSCRVPDH